MKAQIKRFITFSELKKMTTVILDQGLVSLSTFLISVVLANNFDKTQYANFILLTSVTMTILGFQRAIITQPFAINFHDYSGFKKFNYFNYNVFLKIIFNVLLIIIFPLYLFLNKDYSNGFFLNLLLLFYVLTFTSYFFVKDMLISSRQTKKAFYFGASISVLIFLLLAVTYISEIIDFQILLLGLSCVYLLAFMAFFFLKKRAITFKYSLKNQFLKDNWQVGKWIVGSNLLYSIFAQATPWIILYFLSKEDVAIYGVLISVTSLINPIMKSLSAYLLPLFTTYRNQINYLKKKFIFWEIVFMGIALVLLIFGVVFGEWVVTIIFGSKYANLGWIVVLPFINQAINLLFQPVDIVMNALKRTDLGFYMLIFRTVISLILAYVFISNFGLVGVFIARIIENILYQSILFIKTFKLMTI